MHIEVEIKAWVRERTALEAKLKTLGAKIDANFEKSDSYFRYREHGKNQDVRIREESGKAVVTYKDKTIESGLEVNREYEFVVSDPIHMEELLLRLGAKPLVKKRKKGQLWTLPGNELHIEVSEVQGLGVFVEIERLFPQGTMEAGEGSPTIKAAESEIRSLLMNIGVKEEDIESRTYTSMLQQRAERDISQSSQVFESNDGR